MRACYKCKSGFYFDANNGDCKTNQEDDDLKFCTYFTSDCLSCERGFYLDEEKKCVNTKNCPNSELGECKKCKDKFHFDKDKKCNYIENCFHTNVYDECIECDKGYFYNKVDLKCDKAQSDNMKNCKMSYSDNKNEFVECKRGFYLSRKDKLCKENKDKGPFYKCLITDFNSTECIMCKNGYYFARDNNRLCVPTNHCNKINEDNECVNVKEISVLIKKLKLVYILLH